MWSLRDGASMRSPLLTQRETWVPTKPECRERRQDPPLSSSTESRSTRSHRDQNGGPPRLARRGNLPVLRESRRVHATASPRSLALPQVYSFSTRKIKHTAAGLCNKCGIMVNCEP